MTDLMTSHAFRAVVVEGLDRHGFLTTPQLAAWTCSDATDEAVKKRLKRMKAEGLLEEHLVRADHNASVPCWTLTKMAQVLTSGSHRPVLEPKPGTARHHLVVAQVAIELRRAGHHVTTERELWFERREHREAHGFRTRGSSDAPRRIRVWPDGRPLRYSEPGAVERWAKSWAPELVPDLRVHGAGDPTNEWGVPLTRGTAWEIELTTKAPQRLQRKLAWYDMTAGYAQVVYWCGDAAVSRAVERAAREAAPKLRPRVEVLSDTLLHAAVSGRSSSTPDYAAAVAALLLAMDRQN